MKNTEIAWKTGRFFVVLWAVLLIVMQGCEKDPKPANNSEINDWILQNMQLYYLWNTHIPGRTDKTVYPGDYFESLLYRTEDRFSWIQDNYTELMKFLSGVNTEAGYEFILFRDEGDEGDSTHVYGCIAYIKPGTPAEKAGLKRGDFFSSINGATMTMKNYQELLSRISQSHTIGIMNMDNGAITPVDLSVIEYAENPILLDTIYHIDSKKIGYFVYNFFARDNDLLGITYEKELNNLFGKYKSGGINELIIDLRYNTGGAVITAIALASMISNRSTDDVFSYSKFNSILDEYFSKKYGKNYDIDYFLDDIERYDSKGKTVEKVRINKLENFEKIYLIVDRNTASASELIINCLKPYMGVVLIGGTTVGKNVGSITIYEEDEEKQKTNTWGMQPIVLKYENKDHKSDYESGFAPDAEAGELEIGMRELGDTDELMLSAALDYILGRKKSLQTRSAALELKMVGSSIDRIPVRKNMYYDSRFFRKKNQR